VFAEAEKKINSISSNSSAAYYVSVRSLQWAHSLPDKRTFTTQKHDLHVNQGQVIVFSIPAGREALTDKESNQERMLFSATFLLFSTRNLEFCCQQLGAF
jgi:hypothetical protein